MIRCCCGQILKIQDIEEGDGALPFVRFSCPGCRYVVGAEGTIHEVSELLPGIEWTDEARYTLQRMPPYVETLVRREVENYAEEKRVRLITSSFMIEAQHGGAVAWEPEAERRLSRVPAPVRAMARVELERTALDRGLPEVSVELMEEVKARYFGMAAPST